MSTRRPALVFGALHVTPPDRATGWCMLADQPQSRATVELLVDGTVAVAMVAALHSPSPGDGRHGFAVTLPAPLDAPAIQLIEARERSTGLIFARIVLQGDRVPDPVTRRLSGLDTTVLRAPLMLPKPAPPADLTKVFAGLGAALGQQGRDPWREARAALTRQAPRLRLSERPALSIILACAQQARQTMAQLVALQPLCDEMPAEILLADQGVDPFHLLLPQILPGLRYLRWTGGLCGAALNSAAAMARGAALCVVARPDAPGRWAWPAWHDGEVHLGGAAARAASSGPAAGQARMAYCEQHGAALRLSRTLFDLAGGCDPALAWPEACADLADKCALLGAPVLLWLDRSGERERWPASAARVAHAVRSRTARAPRRVTPAESSPTPR